MVAKDAAHVSERRARARQLIRHMQTAEGTVVERYLRNARGYEGSIPATLGFLPPWQDLPPRMVGLFGIPVEPEPGKLDLPLDRVPGIHVTRLKPDGSGREDGEKAKIIMGRSKGHPLVLAPMNDSLGLLICEGIETGLSWRDATGLGVWVSCGANRMPALSETVPDYVDCVLIDREAGDAGWENANELAARLHKRGIHFEIFSVAPKTKKVA